MDSEDYRRLSGNSVMLLLALAYQYRGHNNGDLTAAFSIMQKKFGFKHQTTLSKALKSLIDSRMVIRTRTSQFCNPGRKCALFALTWQPIDECNGKLECTPTVKPPRKFSMKQNK